MVGPKPCHHQVKLFQPVVTAVSFTYPRAEKTHCVVHTGLADNALRASALLELCKS